MSAEPVLLSALFVACIEFPNGVINKNRITNYVYRIFIVLAISTVLTESASLPFTFTNISPLLLLGTVT